MVVLDAKELVALDDVTANADGPIKMPRAVRLIGVDSPTGHELTVNLHLTFGMRLAVIPVVPVCPSTLTGEVFGTISEIEEGESAYDKGQAVHGSAIREFLEHAFHSVATIIRQVREKA